MSTCTVVTLEEAKSFNARYGELALYNAARGSMDMFKAVLPMSSEMAKGGEDVIFTAILSAVKEVCEYVLELRKLTILRIQARAHAATASVPNPAASEVHLDINFDMNRATRSTGTPLQYAVRHQLPEICELLIANGADVNARDISGRNAVHYFAGALYAFRSPLILDILIRSGADIHARDGDGNTPLHIAVKRGHLMACRLLMTKGAIVEAVGEMKMTPLHIAVRENNLEMCKILLDGGADINARTPDMRTPLHLCVMNGNIAARICTLLVYRGAMMLQDVYGHTPFQIVAMGGMSDLMQIFTKRLRECTPAA